MTEPAGQIPPDYREAEPIGAFLLRRDPRFLLGRGAFSETWRAWQPALGRAVALKIFTGAVADSLDAETLARIREREIPAMVRLAGTPGIASPIEAGETADGVPWIAMELIPGRSLRDLLEQQAMLDVDRAVSIAVGICEALAAAHDAGIWHRDIKPENVVLAEQGPHAGRPVLVDWGTAKIRDAAARLVTDETRALGTRAYMAPERLVLGAREDHRADIYSVGAVLYEMLTGFPPEEQENPKVADLRPQEVQPELDRILARALARDPNRRYDSARALAADLDAYRSGRYRRHRMPRRPLAAAGIAAAALAVAVAYAFISLRNSRSTAATLPPPISVPPVLPGPPPSVDLPHIEPAMPPPEPPPEPEPMPPEKPPPQTPEQPVQEEVETVPQVPRPRRAPAEILSEFDARWRAALQARIGSYIALATTAGPPAQGVLRSVEGDAIVIGSDRVPLDRIAPQARLEWAAVQDPWERLVILAHLDPLRALEEAPADDEEILHVARMRAAREALDRLRQDRGTADWPQRALERAERVERAARGPCEEAAALRREVEALHRLVRGRPEDLARILLDHPDTLCAPDAMERLRAAFRPQTEWVDPTERNRWEGDARYEEGIVLESRGDAATAVAEDAADGWQVRFHFHPWLGQPGDVRFRAGADESVVVVAFGREGFIALEQGDAVFARRELAQFPPPSEVSGFREPRYGHTIEIAHVPLEDGAARVVYLNGAFAFAYRTAAAGAQRISIRCGAGTLRIWNCASLARADSGR